MIALNFNLSFQNKLNDMYLAGTDLQWKILEPFPFLSTLVLVSLVHVRETHPAEPLPSPPAVGSFSSIY